MKAQDALIKKVEGHVAFLTLNRPKQANALSKALFLSIKREMDALDYDDTIRVTVITGAGDKAFCAGIDLKERAGMPEHEVMSFRTEIIKPCFDSMRRFSKPLIAAVNGVAFGGGAELALACDLRIASGNAKFAQSEIRWGMIPACGACQRLRMIVGTGRAKEIIFTGGVIEAEEAARLGIYNKLVPEEHLAEDTKTLAAEISKNSLIALKQAKKAVDLGAGMSESLELEFELSKECYYAGGAMTGPAGF